MIFISEGIPVNLLGRRSLCACAWLFVVGVTAVDVHWALRYRDSVEQWESNPVMLWVMGHYGIGAAVLTRFGTVIFAAGLMTIAPRRCQLAATATVVIVHVYLAATYVMIVWGTDVAAL